MEILPIQFPIHESLKGNFVHLTPKTFQSCLEGKDPFDIQALVIGVGAQENERLVGLTFATVHTKIQTAHIHFLTIEKIKDAEHIAAKLLQALETLLKKEKVILATFTYPQEQSSLLEKCFLENKWTGPRLHIIECLFKRADFDPNWWYKNIELAPDFEEFLFRNLTRHEQQDILRRKENRTIPSYVLPFSRDKNLIEYKNSLGLRYQGKVVGWMITHRIEPDTIRYSALYLDDAFTHTGYWLKLLIDALHIHHKMQHVTYGKLEINVEQVPKRWLKFIERRLFPHACQISYQFMFMKHFN